MIYPFTAPSSLSITKWAYQTSKSETLPDWDEMITTLENADLLLKLVSDLKCPRRASVLRCLYTLVGISASRHIDVEIVKIKELLDKAKYSPDKAIVHWVEKSRMLLGDLKKFDYIEWCKGGLSEKDLPTVH